MSEADKIIEIPDFSLVVLIGSTGSGKSTFAAQHFLPTEVISSDHCRALVSDDEADQSVTADAFDLVREIAGKRLKHRKLAVIDATNVRSCRSQGLDRARSSMARVAGRDCFRSRRRRLHRAQQDAARPRLGGQVIQRMVSEVRRGLGGLQREGFRQVWKLTSAGERGRPRVTRQPLWTDKRNDAGPFDIIGDVHGCADELQALLDEARVPDRMVR